MLAFAALLTLGAAACGAAAVPVPVAADAARASARWPDADLGQLTSGRNLYVRKCGGCHTLVPPRTRPPEAWPPIVEVMATRIGLPERERELITRYVVTISDLAPTASSR